MAAEKHLTFAAAVVVILFLVWGAVQLCKPSSSNQPALADISAFRIPYDSFRELNRLSAKYRIPFYELLTFYSQEFRFFPDKSDVMDSKEIELKFLSHYRQLKRKNTTKETSAYENMFRQMLTEMKVFPISEEYRGSCVFSDSWGAARVYGGERKHEGTDILDRENIRAHISVVSMTDGKIQELGWNELGGYRVGILTKDGNYYYYAHFDHFAPDLKKGDSIRAGQLLGYMGDTGYGTEGTRGEFPVHLHVGVCPAVSFASSEFWINPYPFLRYLEEKNS